MIAAAMSLLLAACGDGADDQSGDTTAPTSAAVEDTAESPDDDSIDTADEPISSEPTATDAPTPTTAAATTMADDRELLTVVDGWQRIDALDADDLDWIEPLPDGGFIAGFTVGRSLRSLMWSPDGLNWFDGDPQGLAPPSRAAAVVGDQVIILEDDDDALILWIGDPTTGRWEPMMDLDTSGLETVRDHGVVAAGNDTVLVAATTAADVPSTPGDRVEVSPAVWLVDPVQREATRTSFTIEALANSHLPPTVWFDVRWHLLLPLVLEDWDAGWTEIALWSSPDGTTWTDDGLPEGMTLPMLAVDWITGGSSGVVTSATHDGNTGAWFSPNGVDWEYSGRGFYGRSVYSDSLGFVLENGGPWFWRLLPDGTIQEDLASPFPGDLMGASGNNLIVHAFRGDEYSESESAGVKGLWLYHEAGGID